MTWQGVATSVVALAAFCTALGVLSRLKPMKWLWRQNVKDPLSGWLREVVDERLEHKLQPIRYQLETNNGSSIKDAISRVEATTDKLTAAVERLTKSDVVKKTHIDSIDAAVALHIDKFHTKET